MNLQHSGFKTKDEYLARIFGRDGAPKNPLAGADKMLENVGRGLASRAGKLDKAIEDLLNYGRLFENSDKLTITMPKSGLWAGFLRLILGSKSPLVVYEDTIKVGVAHSLRDAFNATESYDKIAAAPLIIAGKSIANKEHDLREYWLNTLTELDVGIDAVGVLKKGKPIVLACHGKGILISDYNRILKAYNDGLTAQNGAKFKQSEFDKLLKSFNGEIYTVDDVVKGNIKNPFGAYAVALDFEKVKLIESRFYPKIEFMENPLVLAEAGTLEYLEEFFDNYFETVKDDSTVGCWHRFNESDSNISQGHLLFVSDSDDGLDGGSGLNCSGCFVVVVAPEAHVAQK